MTSTRVRRRWASLLVSLALACGGLVTFATPADAVLRLLQPDPAQPATFVGHGGYSADGLGQGSDGGTVQAEVPGGSTVVRAYLYGSYHWSWTGAPQTTVVGFDGADVELASLPNSEPGNSALWTARGDVTALVAAAVGSGGGSTDFTITRDTDLLHGVALVVLYANPASPEVTIAVLDGGSKQAGDAVTLTFAAPLAAGFSGRMSLGIGFSCSGGICSTDPVQSSYVEVNGARLTNAAGGYDDGFLHNTALITVGGVGDSPANPTSLSDTAADDELYDLTPFMAVGDTMMRVRTYNPTNDDNLFLAVIQITGIAAVTTEVCDNGIDDDGDGLTDAADPGCVVPAAPTSTIFTGPTSGQYSDPVTLSGTLRDTAAAAGVPGETLDFTLGSLATTAGPTGADGSASAAPLVLTLAPGGYSLLTSFAGDAAHLASSDTDAFTVLTEDCTIAYVGDTLVDPLAHTRLAAQFGEPDAHPGDWSGKTVQFTVTDSAGTPTTHTAVTGADGRAELSLPLNADVYAVSVGFAGDAHYGTCASASDTVVTVAEAGNKATGGGFITSGGRTNFGFNLVPQTDGTWKGQLQVRTASKQRFHGNVVLSATSTGKDTVTWTGTGRWNGEDGYTYVITVADKGSSGKKAGDVVSLVIHPTGDAGSPVYTSGGAVKLAGGNVVVH